jgi:hypothetical protein
MDYRGETITCANEIYRQLGLPEQNCPLVVGTRMDPQSIALYSFLLHTILLIRRLVPRSGM